MADSYLGRSSVIFLVIVLIVQSNHGLSVDKPHLLDIDANLVWIYASTISEVSKIVKFRSYGRSTTMDSKIVTPGDVKCRLILKLVKGVYDGKSHSAIIWWCVCKSWPFIRVC